MSNIKKILSPDAVRRTIGSISLRFPLPLTFAVLLTLWGIISQYAWTSDYDYIFHSVTWALTEGFLLTLAIDLWCEFGFGKKILGAALTASVAVVAADLALLLIRGGTRTEAETIGRFAVSTALVTAILFLPAVSRYSRRQLWMYTLIQFGAVARAVYLGIVIAAACLIINGTVSILFNFDDYRLTVSVICILAGLLPCVVYLSTIPRRRELENAVFPDNIAATFCKNVVLPLVVVYTIILYVYEAKTLLTWTLPNVSVTWMVTGLMTAVLVMLYGLQHYSFSGDDSGSGAKIAAFARKYAPVALLPLLIMMSAGLVYRVREYGITASRLYVTAFNIWAYATVIYLIVRKNTNLNLVAASFSVVFALVSVIPGLNLSSIAENLVRNDVVEALHKAGVEQLPVTVDEARSALSRLNEREAKNTASKIEYLDSWRDHSAISDIVRDDSRIYDFNVLPEEFNSTDTSAYTTYFEMSVDDNIEIPAGSRRMAGRKSYYDNIKVEKTESGIARAELTGYTIEFSPDSLLNNRLSNNPFAVTAVGANGDSATIVFTELNIQKSNKGLEIHRASYYIFTK